MTSSRPYLIRALWEWIDDNKMLPYILVDVTHPEVKVPDGYAKDGQIVLNISLGAVNHLVNDNKSISFAAGFGGVLHEVFVPINAVKSIYAKETGMGMVFDDSTESDEDLSPQYITPIPRKTSYPPLKLVK